MFSQEKIKETVEMLQSMLDQSNKNNRFDVEAKDGNVWNYDFVEDEPETIESAILILRGMICE